MSADESVNPYQAPVTIAEPRGSDVTAPTTTTLARVSLPRTALRWFFVCGISATPSFLIAYSDLSSPAAPMITGVILFAVGYTILDYKTARSAIRRNRRVAWTLRIAYGTRILITIIYPIGIGLDLICGLTVVPVCEWVLGSEDIALRTFGGALFTTLAQGFVLNAIVAVYAGLIYVIQWVLTWIWKYILVPRRS